MQTGRELGSTSLQCKEAAPSWVPRGTVSTLNHQLGRQPRDHQNQVLSQAAPAAPHLHTGNSHLALDARPCALSRSSQTDFEKCNQLRRQEPHARVWCRGQLGAYMTSVPEKPTHRPSPPSEHHESTHTSATSHSPGPSKQLTESVIKT